jgi:hypothetical protein
VHEVTATLSGRSFELIVVNDTSTEITPDETLKLHGQFQRLRLLCRAPCSCAACAALSHRGA